MLNSIFMVLMVCQQFFVNSQGVELTPAFPVISPDDQTLTNQSRQSSQTINCSTQGTPDMKNLTSLRITFSKPSDAGLQTAEEELGTISVDSEEGESLHDMVTNVSGSLSVEDPARAYLSLELGSDPCGSVGKYRCYLEYLNQLGQRITTDPPASATVSFSALPGPLTMTVEPETDTFPMASVVRLTCGGPAGSEPHDVSIRWQWAAVDSEPDEAPSTVGLNFTDFIPTVWDEVTNSTLTENKSIGEPIGSCGMYSVQSTLARTLTEADRYRTYRCYPKLADTHLVHRAATFRIHTELPKPKLTVIPKQLEFAGDLIVRPFLPLQLHCREQHRPMDPLMHLRIQLLHKDKVIVSAEGGLNMEDLISNDSNSTSNSTSRGNNRMPTTTSSITFSNDSNLIRNSTAAESEEDRSWHARYNVNVLSYGLQFLCLTTFTQDCQSGGSYQCRFSYTLAIQGAHPVTITQVDEASLPVQMAPQRPNMTVSWERVQYPVSTAVRLTCSALIGGPDLTALWVWEVCRSHGKCSAGLKHKTSKAVYYENICQYQQNSSVVYKFQSKDKDVVYIRCYVTRNGFTYSSAVRNFTVISGGGSVLRALGSKEFAESHAYKNIFVSLVAPVMLSLVALAFLLVGVIFTCQRYQRLQHRLQRTVYRRSQSRTEHFRKRRPHNLQRQKPEETPRPTRAEAMGSFFRTAYSILADKSEVELVEQEKKLHKQSPSQRNQLRMRQRLRMKRMSRQKQQTSAQTRGRSPVQQAISMPSTSGIATPSCSTAADRSCSVLEYRPQQHGGRARSHKRSHSMPPFGTRL